MQTITIVSSNPGKLLELQVLAAGKLDIVMQDVALDEIQSLSLEAIVKDKARKAYEQLKTPVIVEDVSAGLASLKGLPGPFIKFFNKTLGNDALYQLAASPADQVTIQCVAAYYDGKQYTLGTGTITGKLVSPRGEYGFGFDCVVVPDGHTQTMAEMTTEEKSAISHRGQAFRSLVAALTT